MNLMRDFRTTSVRRQIYTRLFGEMRSTTGSIKSHAYPIRRAVLDTIPIGPRPSPWN